MENDKLFGRMNDAEYRQVSCWTCAHKTPGSKTCKAFPQGIPAAIARGDVSHKQPYRGDNGIRYTPARKGMGVAP